MALEILLLAFLLAPTVFVLGLAFTMNVETSADLPRLAARRPLDAPAALTPASLRQAA